MSERATSEVDVAGDIGLPGIPPVVGATIDAPARVITRPAVSVVVCAYTEDRWEDLSRAVSSLRGQTEPPREIILVIDHCPGLLRRAVAELTGVRVAPNRLAKGLSGARNTGLAEAQGDVVAFLDDDAAADPDWIARLADCYAEARVVGVGGLVKPAWETGRPPWFPPELDWVVGCCYLGMPTGSGPVRNFIGANMSFRREVLEDLSGFTIGLGRIGTVPLGCEETELCLRVSQRYPDGVLLYEPAAAVSHKVRKPRASWSYLRSRCYAEGLSKARVAQLSGAQRALASERSYVRSTIPRGVGRSLAHAARGRLAGLGSALALVLAVVLAGVGYVVGRATGPVAGLAPAPVTGAQASPRASRHALVPWIGLTVCLGLWVIALSQVDVSGVRTAGLGLVSLLPVTFWVAVGVLMVGFCLAVLRRSIQWPVLAAHVLALVVILHATPVILYGTLRYSWAWKHVGVIDYVIHHGVDFHLGGILGAYQGWPGFFALNSFLVSASGQGSALSYASWALPVNDLLWLGPVILIARALTSDQRLIWTAAWLFALGNWVGQDYFSPQALAYFLYLTVIAVCLRWLRVPWTSPGRWARLSAAVIWVPARRGTPDDADSPAPVTPAATRRVLVIFLLPLMAAIASTHQLTPFMLIVALTLLVLFRQIRPWWLPVAMTAITGGWLAYGGLPWLASNTSRLINGMGLPWANTSAHIIGGTQVPPDQIIVEWGARLLTVAIMALAGIGYLRYLRHHHARARRTWLSIPLLAAAGIPAAAANDYGGEIIFRVFLFAVPFLAIAAAAAFFPHPRAGRPALTGPVLMATTLALAAGFILSNYGSEAINYFSPAEVAASKWLYRTAPAGTQVVAANSNFPWAFEHYNWYSYTFLDTPMSLGTAALRAPVKTMVPLMEPGHTPASYLILTKSQAAAVVLGAEWPAGEYSRFVHNLLASAQFRVVYHNADAMILQLTPPGFRQLAPYGVLQLSPAASVRVPPLAVRVPPPAQARQPHPAASAGPAGTRSRALAAGGCQIGNPAQFLLAPDRVPALVLLAPGHVPSPGLADRVLAQIAVPAQTRALLRRCR